MCDDKNKKVAIILAGGQGERLWPLSTKEHPKQVLDVFTNKPMIIETISRILPIIDSKDIYIITNKTQYDLIKEIISKQYSDINFCIEPAFKGTAAAILLGVFKIQSLYNDPEIVVLASDHIVQNDKGFVSVLEKAFLEAKKNQIVTIGIKPSKPNTGYGYIEISEEDMKKEVCRVRSFHEKPTFNIAKEYFKSKKYFWNSGVFIFNVSTILKEFNKNAKTHYDLFCKMVENPNEWENYFVDFPNISIDYAIMEKASDIVVIKGEFGWSDIGDYSSFNDIFKENNNKDIIINSNVYQIESNNNTIITTGKKIGLIGISDMIIVETANEILICKKENLSEMKSLLKKIND